MLIPAGNVSEAVRMAEEMKQKGTHTWFRGQTRNWTLQSSLARHPEKYEESTNRINQLSGWLKSVPALESLWGDVDGTLIVAQHYGIPTHFIDFSTEPSVAGFFASENAPVTDSAKFDFDAERRRFFASEPVTEDVGCILCLNCEDLMRVWRAVSRVRPVPPEEEPEFITRTVPDLWRLEAQHGVFFYCPLNRFEEAVYDIDRIVFPHQGQVSGPPREHIYPERKSHLEILLDQYFLLERIESGQKAWKERGLDKLAPNRLDFHNEGDDSMPLHPSWETGRVRLYLQPEAQSFLASLSDTSWFLDFSIEEAANAVGQSITRQVLDRLAAAPSARKELIRWKSSHPVFDQAVSLIWDGLRSLPCTDEDLAISIGNTAGLYAAAEQIKWSNEQSGKKPPHLNYLLSVSGAYFEDKTLEVEFGARGGGYSRGFISRQSLVAAFRDDLIHFIDQANRDALFSNPGEILVQFLQADRMFPFERFEKLFLHEVVPSQALWRPRNTQIFSPARISIFGLP